MKGVFTVAAVFDNDEYIKIIRSRLRDARYEHSLNVADEAVRLAEKYGADPQKAYVAGILHDAMKEEKAEIQLEAILKSGVNISVSEIENIKLWHAIAGSVFIQNELGVKDADIINAVRYHTTARAGMSVLEKVIYIADFTSRERTYDGVENMRRLADESLERAMLEGLSFTLSKLTREKKLINLNSVNAYNEVVAVCGGE